MKKTIPPEILSAVHRTPLFSALSDAAVQSLLSEGLRVKVPAGKLLFMQGGEADRFYTVLTGRVKIFQLSPRGDEQILHLYGPGDTFGEAAMLMGGSFPASAEATVDSTVLDIRRQALRQAIKSSPELAMGMLAGLSSKLREFTRLIEQLSLKEVPARLAAALLAEVMQTKPPPQGRRTFTLKQTKRHLAGQIGTAPETLSRAFAKLKADGVIKVSGPEITILDMDALRDAAENG